MPDEPTIADVLDRLDQIAERLESGPVRYLTIDGAAAYCGLSAKSIRRLVSRGELEVMRPVKGRLLVDRHAIDSLCLSSKRSVRRGRGVRAAK